MLLYEMYNLRFKINLEIIWKHFHVVVLFDGWYSYIHTFERNASMLSRVLFLSEMCKLSFLFSTLILTVTRLEFICIIFRNLYYNYMYDS